MLPPPPLLRRSPAGKKVQTWRKRLEEAQHDLPEVL